MQCYLFLQAAENREFIPVFVFIFVPFSITNLGVPRFLPHSYSYLCCSAASLLQLSLEGYIQELCIRTRPVSILRYSTWPFIFLAFSIILRPFRVVGCSLTNSNQESNHGEFSISLFFFRVFSRFPVELILFCLPAGFLAYYIMTAYWL